jgi:hypothetical protein
MIGYKKKGEFKVEMVLQSKRIFPWQQGQGEGEYLLFRRSFLGRRKEKVTSKGNNLI